MVLTEWSSSPHGGFPTNYTDMKRVLEAEPICPVSNKPTAPMSITLSQNPEQEFKALVELMKDSGPFEDEKDKENEDDDDL